MTQRRETRTQVGIVGAGPAGLVLAKLLALSGIESVVLESRDRAYVEARVRAGVLEAPTVELLREMGVAGRLDREGMPHTGIALRFAEAPGAPAADHRIDFADLVGTGITVYGQQEVVKDLLADRVDATGLPVEFGVTGVALHDVDTDTPSITYAAADGTEHVLRCDVIAGCDGFHGVSRPLVAPEIAERVYPFSWLGVLAKAAPTTDELVYAHHDDGFALYSMRSPEVTRLYVQVPNDTDPSDWSDARIWDALHTRLACDGFTINEGEFIEKPSVTPMRSMVASPMRRGRLFLAGDAAHIVPPTGAKGMNLAIADVRVLADAVVRALRDGDDAGLDGYSETCLRRVWRAEHFSWFMTSMLHRFDPATEGGDAFGVGLQRSQLRYTVTSRAAATSLAENYVGLPHGAV
ncbi:P-hydroxybenzoate hydroxylase [Pseudonocardia sp. Ae406_Ps2]|uniref:4-hydroxybenzoate 3-monooxygenase n=1 Tax=unclassified Pseudonocardia TaxID=2619320 RepID=UPI000318E49C|nr:MULTISPECIES: 4-hydroxybenzoate 3-monooxygenase [unclassified Pseudonocardia]OLL99782.1 P-hydroxybenzoate hydroxylase [Pseudonocardia sp. Ae331_Ps2]OLM02468.1 P-hydroxybenzoate hydroxylase [Pseudonocardia sp. Ae406_Ps2]OLM12698.1 P-hydroxybenzoate hydroxylase [Pseudonocardia sp. Ae505_Ps2]OLM24040.1 P-hydroxybenzoate hydroxylase [Pseudonocardia sp. Ae706_Ps2]